MYEENFVNLVHLKKENDMLVADWMFMMTDGLLSAYSVADTGKLLEFSSRLAVDQVYRQAFMCFRCSSILING